MCFRPYRGDIAELAKKYSVVNIQKEMNLFKRLCVRPERREGGENLGKIIVWSSSNRLGAIINKPPEAVETRTGKQQRIHIPNNSHCLWCYLYISWYCRVYQQSNISLCPWSKKTRISGKMSHIYEVYKLWCHAPMIRLHSMVTSGFCTQYTNVLGKIFIFSLSLCSRLKFSRLLTQWESS